MTNGPVRSAWFAVALALASPGASAQQAGAPAARPAEICRYLDGRGLLRCDAELDVAALPLRQAPFRFAELLSRFAERSGTVTRPRQVECSGIVVHAHGAPEIVRLAAGALTATAGADPAARARLQFVWLRLPPSVAVPEGVVADRATATTDTRLGELSRAVTAAGGALRNVPEVVAAPLEPVAAVLAGDGAAALRLRLEFAVVERNEVLLGLHVVRGDLPARLAALPPAGAAVLASPVLQLPEGALHWLAVRDAEGAAVLAVRCVAFDANPSAK